MTLSKALVSCQPVSCIAAGQGPTTAQWQPVCGQTLVGAKLSKLQNCFAPSGQWTLTVAVVFLPFPSAGMPADPRACWGSPLGNTERDLPGRLCAGLPVLLFGAGQDATFPDCSGVSNYVSPGWFPWLLPCNRSPVRAGPAWERCRSPTCASSRSGAASPPYTLLFFCKTLISGAGSLFWQSPGKREAELLKFDSSFARFLPLFNYCRLKVCSASLGVAEYNLHSTRRAINASGKWGQEKKC